MIQDTIIGILLTALLALGSLTPSPAPQPEAAGAVGTAAISGTATWYDAPSAHDAAAGPALRVGDWRGSWVRVSANGRSVRVQLTDACWCIGNRLLDLDDRAFAKLAPLSVGVLEVEVEFGGPALPATDCAASGC